MKTMKRLAALVVCLALICSVLPQVALTVHAESYSGECGAEGSNLSWALDTETGKLTITGSGEMEDFDQWSIPWYDYAASITSLELPDGLQHIGEYAFLDCTGLQSVSIPASVTSIGKSAFQGCTGLTEAALPNGLPFIDWSVFQDCSGLQSVSIPQSVQSIGGYAFSGCSSLTAVAIPQDVFSIGECVFENCASLTSVALPESVDSISNYLFSGCTGLTSVSFSANVYSIGKAAFKNCASLTEITLPSALKFIKQDAFRGCAGLTGVSFPAALESLEKGAFRDCTGLTTVTLPSQMDTIEERTFAGCTGLASVVIPGTISYVENYAFEGCTGLTSLNVPEGVKSIRTGAFEGCTGLTDVSLPDSLISVGARAFRDCSAMKSVTIPASVVSIGNYAFGYVSAEGGPTKVEGFTIYGIEGTSAEYYANENGFQFGDPQIENPFVDVKKTDFFYNAVIWAVKNEVTTGIDDTHFAPNNIVMRSDSMMFFWAANKRPDPKGTKSPFKDVSKKHWAFKAIMWGVENGITGGTGPQTFSPDKTCSRSEILQFLYAAMGKPEYTISNPYSDLKPRQWYYDGAIWAYEKGLEKGENGKFKAKTPCTRGSVVTYLYRFLTGNDLVQ